MSSQHSADQSHSTHIPIDIYSDVMPFPMKSNLHSLKTNSDFFNVFSDLPNRSRRGSHIINECTFKEEQSAGFPTDEVHEICSQTREEIQKLFVQECNDEVESPTLKIHRIHRIRETSCETRIFHWLDEQQIHQVNPSSKREEYYDQKRQNLLKLTAVKADISSVDRVKQTVLQLSKVSKSPLLNRRLNTAPKQAAARFRFEQQPACGDQEENMKDPTVSQPEINTLNAAKSDDLDESDFEFRIHHVSSTASTLSLNSSSFSISNLTVADQCQLKNQHDSENSVQPSQLTALFFQSNNQEPTHIKKTIDKTSFALNQQSSN